MRILLIFLMIFFQSTVSAQQGAEELENKAFKFYLHNENIDSALFYYTTLRQKFQDYRSGYINGMVGKCYLEKDDKQSAKKYLLLSLWHPEPLNMYTEMACITIGDLYMETHDYASALAYYDSSTSVFRAKRKMSRHSFKDGNIKTIYKKSFCLDQLHQSDSAINILTPHIFINFDNYALDSLEAINIVDYCISLLKRKYTEKQIRSELKHAIQGMVYTREIDSSSFKRNPQWKYINLDCRINFFGKDFILYKGGVSVKDFEEATPEGWRKEDFMNELRNSLAYKRIKTL